MTLTEAIDIVRNTWSHVGFASIPPTERENEAFRLVMWAANQMTGRNDPE